MGNNGNRQERVIPEHGYRIVGITKKHIAEHLNLLTDYIISPDPKLFDLRRQNIRFQIYSILSEDIRSVQLPIINRELGIDIRLDDINCCVLRVTKIFQGSPLLKYQVKTGEFIVGVKQGNFTCIKTFAQLIMNITVAAPKSNVSLGVCGEDGKTRIVAIPVSELKAWHARHKGLLGCELAQGWIHKWKPVKQKNNKPQSSLQPQQKSQQTSSTSTKQIPMPIPPTQKPSTDSELSLSDSSNQIDQKCDKLDNLYNKEGVLEIKYKGILKCQQIVDASTICKCKPIDKECERCFIQKDDNFYFFCKKINQIVAISRKHMLPIPQ